MRTSSIIVLMLVTLLVTACGNSGGEAPSLFPDTPRSEVTQLQFSLKEAINEFDVECRDQKGCPEAVGMMVASEDDYAYRCSGFLVSGDIFVTSGHCIPKDLREKGAVCGGRSYFLFPRKDGRGSEKVGCKELQNFNVSEDSLYDYAFFKLDRYMKRATFPINQDKRVNLQNVTIWKVNPHRDKGGRIFSTNCKLQQKSIGSEFFDGPRTGVVNYSGCITRKGNSGSPVLNLKGEVIGIHQSSLKVYSPMGRVLRGHIRTRDFFPSGSATNFGCFCETEGGLSHLCEDQPKSCQVKFTNEELDKRRNFLFQDAFKRYLAEEVRDELLSELPPNLKKMITFDISSGFRLSYDKITKDPVDLKIYATLAPRCLLNKSLIYNNSSNLSISGYEYNRSLNLKNSPLCEVGFNLNKRLQVERMEVDLDKCERGYAFFDFMKEKLYSNPFPGVLVYSAGSFEEMGTPFAQSFNLPMCN